LEHSKSKSEPDHRIDQLDILKCEINNLLREYNITEMPF
jgi:hypothetical protein